MGDWWSPHVSSTVRGWGKYLSYCRVPPQYPAYLLVIFFSNGIMRKYKANFRPLKLFWKSFFNFFFQLSEEISFTENCATPQLFFETIFLTFFQTEYKWGFWRHHRNFCSKINPWNKSTKRGCSLKKNKEKQLQSAEKRVVMVNYHGVKFLKK